jgi:dTDP-4-amino-4,6-dideoxygalactose transaminase
MINVTKSYLPELAEYVRHLEGIWERVQLTNNGPLVQELEKQMREVLGVKHLWYCTNGTVVLQMALKALNITKEVITTPFSYVASTNAILWEGCTPVFADLRPDDLCIDPDRIEALITENTQAILATHVYGNACQIEQIQAIAERHKLHVIYDGAHAFGATYNGRSLLNYGDISTCSFHATKVFHTVEGGLIVTDNDELANTVNLFRSFGHRFDDYFSVGINAKNSELHAAMGLCLLPKLPDLIAARKQAAEWYDARLDTDHLTRTTLTPGLTWNYAYYPVLLDSEATLLRVMDALRAEEIMARRYFYPSLNTLPFLKTTQSCPVSESAAVRVLCLPLYPGLTEADVERIAGIVNQEVGELAVTIVNE